MARVMTMRDSDVWATVSTTVIGCHDMLMSIPTSSTMGLVRVRARVRTRVKACS